jgi:programmed cell death 6-interacting protein
MKAAGDSDAGVLRRLEERRGAFADLTIDAAALKMPRLQVSCAYICVEDAQALDCG